MAQLKPMSFTAPTDYSAEQERLTRQQVLADRLRQQADQPYPQGQMLGGWYVPTSPLEGVAKVLRAYTAAKKDVDIERHRKELSERYQSDLKGVLGKYGEAMAGSPEKTIQPDPQEIAQSQDYGTPAVQPSTIHAQKPNQALAAQLLMGHPATQQAGLNMLLKQREPIKLGKDDRLLNPTDYSQVVGPIQTPKFHSIGGNLVQEPSGGTPAQSVFKAPEKPDELTQALVAAGIDPKSPEAQALFKARASKLATHAPAPGVSVRVEQKTGESLAKEVGPMMAESLSSAQGAVKTVDTVTRIKKALETGNLSIGPTATVRQQINQVAQIVGATGASTEEKLVNTRNVIRGLAEMAVEARKMLKNQGSITENETKLVQRAASGEIQDFTIPELKDFVNVSERLARDVYKEHKRRTGVMEKNPALKPLVPFYEAPQMPDEGGEWKEL